MSWLRQDIGIVFAEAVLLWITPVIQPSPLEACFHVDRRANRKPLASIGFLRNQISKDFYDRMNKKTQKR